MDRFREFMSRRVGGIPVGIIAVLVAGIVLVLALRMKSSSTDTIGDEITDEPGGDADSGGDLTNPTFSASPTTSTVIAVPAEDTNELWGTRARDWLMSHGSTPSAAQQLVSKYLGSEPLTAAERTLVDNVIHAIGYPPDPPELVDLLPEPTDDPGTSDDTGTEPSVPPPPTGGGTGGNMPPTKQGVPPCHHTVVNARDNGPGELAVLYYGSNAPQKVNRLEAANWELGTGPWAVGTTVKIPDDHPPVFFRATQNCRSANDIAAKNGVDPHFIKVLNPGMNFPVAVGTNVRIN